MDVKKININQSELTYNIASEIYDVSAHNDGVSFTSLSELLSSENLYTLIPTEVRCGGMTIRFIQSSDNKYVQYRLMTTSFSTFESDWQGVDDHPTAGSDNLIKSGGVFSSISVETTRATAAEEANAQAITDIMSEVEVHKNTLYPLINIFDNSNVLYGKMLTTGSGSKINYVADNSNCTLFGQIWEVKEGDIIRTNFIYTLTVLFYGDDKVLKSTQNLLRSTHVTIPSDVSYIRIQRGVAELDVSDIMITINRDMPNEYVPYGTMDALSMIRADIEKTHKILKQRLKEPKQRRKP